MNPIYYYAFCSIVLVLVHVLFLDSVRIKSLTWRRGNGELYDYETRDVARRIVRTREEAKLCVAGGRVELREKCEVERAVVKISKTEGKDVPQL